MIRIKEYNILKVFTIGFVPIAESQRDIQIAYEEKEKQFI